MTCALLVLAAGESRRFGVQPKQAAQWRGEALLTHVARRAQQVAAGEVYLVLGAYADVLMPLAPPGCKILIHDNWQQGMGASLAYGVAQLPVETAAVVVLMADQIDVSVADMRKLIAVAERGGNERAGEAAPRVACAQYEHTFGVPAYFSHHYFSALRALSGDRGAKHLLASLGATLVPMPSAAIDIDTPADFEQFSDRETASAKAID